MSFRLFIKLLKLTIKTDMGYRMSYILGSIGAVFGYLAEVVMLVILVCRFKTIGGWGPWEVAFLYGLNLCSYTMGASFMYRTVESLPLLIQNGDFDGILIRPVNPLYYLISKNTITQYNFRFLLGLAICLTSIYTLNVSCSISNISFFVITLISGAIIQGSLFLLSAIPAFWIINSGGFRVFFFCFKDFINYPLTIYNDFIKIILTFFIPYGFISFYPSVYFFGKASLYHPAFQFLSLPVSLIIAFIVYRLWLIGLKSYQSTGS